MTEMTNEEPKEQIVAPEIIQAYMKWTCEACGKVTRHLPSQDARLAELENIAGEMRDELQFLSEVHNDSESAAKADKLSAYKEKHK